MLIPRNCSSRVRTAYQSLSMPRQRYAMRTLPGSSAHPTGRSRIASTLPSLVTIDEVCPESPVHTAPYRAVRSEYRRGAPDGISEPFPGGFLNVQAGWSIWRKKPIFSMASHHASFQPAAKQTSNSLGIRSSSRVNRRLPYLPAAWFLRLCRYRRGDTSGWTARYPARWSAPTRSPDRNS